MASAESSSDSEVDINAKELSEIKKQETEEINETKIKKTEEDESNIADDSGRVPHNEEFMKELEDLAQNRYTDLDKDYVRAKNTGKIDPPLMPDYDSRRGGNSRGHDRYNYKSDRSYHHNDSNRYRKPYDRNSDRHYGRPHY